MAKAMKSNCVALNKGQLMAAPTVEIKLSVSVGCGHGTPCPYACIRQASAETKFGSDLRSQLSRYVASQLDMCFALDMFAKANEMSASGGTKLKGTRELVAYLCHYYFGYLLKIADALGRGFFLLCFFSTWIGVLMSILANTVQKITRMYMPNTA